MTDSQSQPEFPETTKLSLQAFMPKPFWEPFSGTFFKNLNLPPSFQVQQQQSAQADTMKSSVNGYHESLIEALRNAAATTSSQRGSNSSNSFGLGAGGGANTGGAGSNHRSSAASLTVIIFREAFF